MADEAELRIQLSRLSNELSSRYSTTCLLDDYYDTKPPIPEPVVRAKATRAYSALMDLSRSAWPKLVVDSVEERLEVQGVRFGDAAADKDVWADWQRNGLDAEQGLIHQAALTTGRAYAIVWGDADGNPIVTPEHASTVIVEYAAGSRRIRTAALRRWRDVDDRWYATLYRRDGIYKFQQKAQADGTYDSSVPRDDGGWEPRQVDGEAWPLDNPLNEVPVVEFAVNRTLRPCAYGTAAGEFQHALGHIDRINYSVFSGLVAMTWSGFPIRALIGDPILRDDNDQPLPPFDVAADKLVQIENPEGKLQQLPESNLDNYLNATAADVKHFAAITKTPAHYLLAEMVNLSADAIRAAEAALLSKTRRHFRSLGESWEDINRLMIRVRNPSDARAQDMSAEVIWKDPESRSNAERADAAVKLADILPWQAIAERILSASPQEISRWEAQRASDGLSALLAPAEPAPVA